MATKRFILILIVAAILAACGAPATPEPTATATATNTVVPTKTATATATNTATVTPTHTATATNTATATATHTVTATPIPAAVREYVVNNALIVKPELLDGEWVWKDTYGRVVLSYDERTETLMTVSQTKNGSMIVRMDASHGRLIDVGRHNDSDVYQVIQELGDLGQDIEGVKGLDIRIVTKEFFATSLGSGDIEMDYVEVVMLNGTGERYYTKPTLNQSGYLVIYHFIMPGSYYGTFQNFFSYMENFGGPGYVLVEFAVRGARLAYGEAQSIPVTEFLYDGCTVCSPDRQGIEFRPISVKEK